MIQQLQWGSSDNRTNLWIAWRECAPLLVTTQHCQLQIIGLGSIFIKMKKKSVDRVSKDLPLSLIPCMILDKPPASSRSPVSHWHLQFCDSGTKSPRGKSKIVCISSLGKFQLKKREEEEKKEGEEKRGEGGGWGEGGEEGEEGNIQNLSPPFIWSCFAR